MSRVADAKENKHWNGDLWIKVMEGVEQDDDMSVCDSDLQ